MKSAFHYAIMSYYNKNSNDINYMMEQIIAGKMPDDNKDVADWDGRNWKWFFDVVSRVDKRATLSVLINESFGVEEQTSNTI